MALSDLAGRATKSLAALAVCSGLTLSALIVPAHAEPTAPVNPPCNAQRDMLRLGTSLTSFSRKVSSGQPVTIVAIGSSSTAGAGASSAANNYPNRLGVELAKAFPNTRFNVINQGVNGEEVPDMLKRFDTSVIANKPDLVLWQLGTNSLIRDHQMTDRGTSIRQGISRIRAIGADTILIDPQYAPKVIEKPLAGAMLNFISALSKEEDVGLFRRFDVMKRWSEVDRIPMSTFIIADGLHMNDWGYACMASALSASIADAVTRPVVSARAVTSAAPTAVRPYGYVD